MSSKVDFKEDLLRRLNECKERIEKTEKELGEDLSFYKEKIDKAIEAVNEEKIKIALFGSFSDGKSTILSAITGNLGIKIAPEPTTDRIQTYTYKDFSIIDTPGLFSENIPHDEETKKFISEADLIIFILDAVNPMKESQHDVIRWLLKDLGKVDQTVFVINKMDTVADLYDEDDFNRVCNIKKEVVIKTLSKIMGEERKDYKVLCLSADPWAMGLGRWLENKKEYMELSRIGELEKVIESIIEEKREELKKKTIDAILKDIAIRASGEFTRSIKGLEAKIREVKLKYKDLSEQITFINTELNKAVTRIKDRLNSKRQDIVASFHSCNNFDCLKKVADKELGKEGNAIKDSIEVIILQELEPVYEYVSHTVDILEEINKTLEDMDNLNAKLMEFGPKIIKKSGEILTKTPTTILRKAILRLRDFLKLPIKFKPWQALKLAKALQILGVLIETFGTGLKIYAAYKFEKVRGEIIDNVNELFHEVIKDINVESLKKEALKPIAELEDSERALRETIESYESILKSYKIAREIFKKCGEIV